MRLFSICCLCLCGAVVWAAPETSSFATEYVQLGVKTWFSQGADKWQICYRDFVSTYDGYAYYEGRSRLEWENLDNTMPVLFGEVCLLPWLRLGGSYASSEISGGNGTDSDWFDSPDLGYDNQMISQSIADSDGDTTYYDINAYFRLNRLLTVYEKKFKGNLDAFIGYQSYKDELRDRNGVQTVDWDGNPVNEPFEGLASTFDFDWSAIRMGLRGEYPVFSKLLVKADAALLAGAEYEGEGFWNLRTDYKSTPPNFTQKAEDGDGYDVKIGLAYKPIPYLTIEAGYWLFSLNASDGTENTYFADDELYDNGVSEEDLDDVKSTRDGFYVALSGNF